jgi:hypothetical protein
VNSSYIDGELADVTGISRIWVERSSFTVVKSETGLLEVSKSTHMDITISHSPRMRMESVMIEDIIHLPSFHGRHQ